VEHPESGGEVKIEILNSFSGDDKTEIDTNQPEGREQAAKLVQELLRSGSAVFLEKEVNGETYTYRVTGYDSETNKLMIRLDASAKDPDIQPVPRRKNAGRKGRPLGPYRTRHTGVVDGETGRVVSVAPRSGG
jgi:hypothetical protein